MSRGQRLAYDSTEPRDIPASAGIVAGYCNGHYAWSPAGWARFPDALHVPISVTPFDNAGTVLDVETGDAFPWQAPDWVLMRRAAGIDPTCYVNLSNWNATRTEFHLRGIPEPHWWVAHYDNDPTIPAGAVAKQYANEPLTGGHFDLSSVAPVWPGVDEGVPMQLDAEAKRAYVDLAYDASLGRDPETAAARDGWAAKIADDGSNLEEIIAQVLDSPEGLGHKQAVAKLIALLPQLQALLATPTGIVPAHSHSGNVLVK